MQYSDDHEIVFPSLGKWDDPRKKVSSTGSVVVTVLRGHGDDDEDIHLICLIVRLFQILVGIYAKACWLLRATCINTLLLSFSPPTSIVPCSERKIIYFEHLPMSSWLPWDDFHILTYQQLCRLKTKTKTKTKKQKLFASEAYDHTD